VYVHLKAAVTVSARLLLDVNGAGMPAISVPAVLAFVLELVLDVVAVARRHDLQR
jgi:hypothetical protein